MEGPPRLPRGALVSVSVFHMGIQVFGYIRRRTMKDGRIFWVVRVKDASISYVDKYVAPIRITFAGPMPVE